MNHTNGSRLRALVVDDEPPARRRLHQLLEATGRVAVVALARSVEDALQLTDLQSIDVAFLDVHMPEEDGFAFAKKVPFDVPIVFVTAYSTFAVRAFEVSALDYLLKPVDPSRLAEALDRVGRENRRRSSALDPIGQVRATNSPTGHEVLRLQVSSGARFVPSSAVVCIMARDDYTEVFLEDGTSELVDFTMMRWAQQLPRDRFTRLHRGAIAATDRIERVELLGGRWQAHVRGRDQVLPLSREVARELAGRQRRPDLR